MSIAPGPKLSARDYQTACVDEIEKALLGSDRTLVVMATGLGKTVCFWKLIDRFVKRTQQRVMVMAHRSELINQALAKGRSFGIDCDVEMAGQRATGGLLAEARVVVASVQSLNAGSRCQTCNANLSGAIAEWEDEGNDSKNFPGFEMGCDRCLEGVIRRLQKFPPSSFGLVVVDEAHHSTARSYTRVLEWFDNSTKVLGVTATPDRHDEESLGQQYQTVAYEYDLPDAIRDGWLVPIEQQFVEVDDLDLSKARTNKYGDLQDKDVAAAIAESDLHKMVDPTIQLAGDRRTLVFSASVDHAEQMADILNRHKPESAAWLHGGSTDEQRRETLRRFSRGEIQYLCNCALFLEGFDDPGIECVAVGRPTASRALYAQIAGRGTRPLPGTVDGLSDATARRSAIELSQKPSVLVLDYVGNSGRHKLVSTADILGGQESDRVVQLAFELARRNKTGDPVDMAMAIEEAKAAIAKRQDEEERLRQENSKRRSVVAKTTFSTKAVNPFDVFDIAPKREPGWHKGRKPTGKQKAALAKFGVDEGAIAKASFTQASQMLDTLFKRIEGGKCSLKQARILKRQGFSADCSFAEASATIDRIVKSGWKLKGNE